MVKDSGLDGPAKEPDGDAASVRGVPKTVWLYWEQGWDAAPELVRQCRRSWEVRNPDWTVRCLDAATLGEYFDLEEWLPGSVGRPRWCWRAAERCYDAWQRSRSDRQWRMIGRKKLSVQGRSDIVRLNLLARYGGVWADATLWCHRPLDDWLAPCLDSGFFSFHNGQMRNRLGESLRFTFWFLASRRNHEIVRRLLDAAQTYWARRSQADEYFWPATLVNHLYEDDAAFRALYDAMPKWEAPRSEPGARYFAPFTADRLSGVTDDYRALIASDSVPVFKLRHRPVNPLEGYDRIRHLFASLPADVGHGPPQETGNASLPVRGPSGPLAG